MYPHNHFKHDSCSPARQAWAKCETVSVIKQSIIGLNLKLSYPDIGCHTEVKSPSLSWYLNITE